MYRSTDVLAGCSGHRAQTKTISSMSSSSSMTSAPSVSLIFVHKFPVRTARLEAVNFRDAFAYSLRGKQAIIPCLALRDALRAASIYIPR